MTRQLFGGSSDDYVVDSSGRPVINRRIRFYTTAQATTEITDLATDVAGTGTPLTVTSNTAGFWGPVYGPDGVSVMYAGAVDSSGNPPTYVVAVYTHTQIGAVASVNGHTGTVVLAASDVGADAVGAAAAVLATSAQKSANLSDVANAATARTNLGLGTAATQPTSAFDAAGAAAGVQTNLTAEIARATAAESAITAGMQFKTAVVVATTNQALSGLLTIDGVTLTDGQIALLTGQSAGSGNGLWAVHSGAWTRPPNFAAGADASGTSVFVEGGSTGALSTYVVSGTTNNVIGTNVLTFVKTSSSGTSGLVPTAVKTSAYTAAASDLVPVDTTSGNVTITLPTAPADKTQIGVKHVVRGGTNTVSVAAGGADRFNVTGGSATLTLTLLFQSAVLQYASATGLWFVVATDVPLGQLDTRYAVETVETFAASGASLTLGDPSTTGSMKDVTLTANCTITLPAVGAGKSFLIRLTQDGTGSRTATFVLAGGGSPKWGASGVAPTLTATAGAQDELAFHSWGTSWTGGLANKDIK